MALCRNERAERERRTFRMQSLQVNCRSATLGQNVMSWDLFPVRKKDITHAISNPLVYQLLLS